MASRITFVVIGWQRNSNGREFSIDYDHSVGIALLGRVLAFGEEFREARAERATSSAAAPRKGKRRGRAMGHVVHCD